MVNEGRRGGCKPFLFAVRTVVNPCFVDISQRRIVASEQNHLAPFLVVCHAYMLGSVGCMCSGYLYPVATVPLPSISQWIVEIEFGVRATNSSAVISVGSADAPVEKLHSAGEWIWAAAGTMNQPLDLPRNTVCIEFSINSGLAAVLVWLNARIGFREIGIQIV